MLFSEAAQLVQPIDGAKWATILTLGLNALILLTTWMNRVQNRKDAIALKAGQVDLHNSQSNMSINMEKDNKILLEAASGAKEEAAKAAGKATKAAELAKIGTEESKERGKLLVAVSEGVVAAKEAALVAKDVATEQVSMLKEVRHAVNGPTTEKHQEVLDMLRVIQGKVDQLNGLKPKNVEPENS